MSANTYAGLHAARYDALYADKPYANEAAFVAALLAAAGAPRGRLLDVACGTGRHAAAFRELGYDVTGVDYSPDLLEIARANVPGARFELQDMRALELGERFDAVTCLFDAVGYPQDDDGVVAALAGMARHAAPGAPVVVEFLHAPAMLAGAAAVGLRRLELPGGSELVRIAETELDRERSLMQVSYDLIELRPDGGYERWREQQRNRFFRVDEMRGLIERAGLRAERFVPGYAAGEVTDETFHVLAVASVPG